MINTVLFDLDGTLLKMNNDAFEHAYLGSLAKTVSHLIDPQHFIKSLWQATHKMVANDGSKTNEDVFYDTFRGLVGDAYEPLIPVIDDYYHNGFEAARSTIESSQEMIDAVEILKDKGIRLVIATNPMFPKIAVEKRVEWAKLNWEDFDHITHFEICHYCKPNPKYYEEIKQVCDLDPSFSMMVGNDAQEDLVAKTLGFKTYLVDDDLIHRGGDIDTDYQGSRKDFLEFVKGL
ncbi:hypothetical protein AOC36_03095 [Erysipelothrix larvae]|uniref:Hydrolase n=1 Tax=Erysipelothrix larvae TaxID=1514105 RepID=A0A0X8GZ20_9FIRM|nr:HAD family hydrolase [Erysipelothrix larvae]AMC93004.1 hypothetical protein AOC36_03095 [Erysipelothrix larvae]